MIFSAQDYPEVPRLTPEQIEVLNLFDEISQEDGLAIDMNFQAGDIQWLLNYAALHSRTSYIDFPEPERRRHLLRLWLKRDVGRPLVEKFGKHVVTMGEPTGGLKPGGRFKLADAVSVNADWATDLSARLTALLASSEPWLGPLVWARALLLWLWMFLTSAVLAPQSCES